MSNGAGIQIVALLGSSKCGKSTVADYLVQRHGFVRVRFAQPLKDMLLTLGLTPEQVDGPQVVREAPSELLCGKTPRYAMQTLGTEWRDLIDRRLWSRITRRRISDMIRSGVTKIVIDDMRFPHEAEEFGEIGCTILAIRRPCVEPTRMERFASRVPATNLMRRVGHILFGIRALHKSETEWFKIKADAEIENNGTLADLYSNTERTIHAVVR